MSNPDNTGQKQAETQFQPGQSGNPNGRPKGVRNKTTLAVEALLDGQAEALAQAVINKALEGDTTALRVCLDRIAPLRKGRTVSIDLPAINGAADLARAGQRLASALADGELSPDEAIGVLATLEGVKRLYEVGELEQRIAALEKTENDRHGQS